MAISRSYALSFFRQSLHSRRNLRFYLRCLTVESGESEFRGEESKSNINHDVLSENTKQDYTEIVRQVCKIMRTIPRWEQSLISDFPSFNFSDPLFFRELVRQQTNVLLSLHFFRWLCSVYDFLPDRISCNLLFDGLVEAKASRAAKSLLDSTDFNPETASLELYIRCLCEDGLIEEAMDVYMKLRRIGFHPSIETCNSLLLGYLKGGKTDLLWELYEEMMEAGIMSDANVETVTYLIQAFCKDRQVVKGYELLQQVLRDGLDPGTIAYNKLIAGFCHSKNYAGMSEIVHTMIAKHHAPSIYTYQEIINGLCKNRRQVEAYRVFNDLKDRGYVPDRVMYTTVIHGLCEMGWLGVARKLWFQMINKGVRPNEFTYNSMFHGCFKMGDFERAKELYKEMCESGYRETTVSCNTVISGFCLHGKLDEALDVFKNMPKKGIPADVITYNALIQGFCQRGRTHEGMNQLGELIALGLQPSVSSYTCLIETLCQCGDVGKAKQLWDDMIHRGLEPTVRTYDHLIAAYCAQGYVLEGMNGLIGMLEKKLKPEKTTFEKLIQCLMQIHRCDDSLFVLDFMFRIGYALEEGMCHSLVSCLCRKNSDFVEASLSQILERS